MDKNKLMMIVIIVLLVALIGTIAAVSLYLMNNMNNAGGDEEVATAPPIIELTWNDLETFSIGEITRNLLPEEGDKTNRALRATFSLEINVKDPEGKALIELLTKKIDVIKDAINDIVGNITYTEIRSADSMVRLKEQLLTKIRDMFQTTLIWDMNISQYISQ